MKFLPTCLLRSSGESTGTRVRKKGLGKDLGDTDRGGTKRFSEGLFRQGYMIAPTLDNEGRDPSTITGDLLRWMDVS